MKNPIPILHSANGTESVYLEQLVAPDTDGQQPNSDGPLIPQGANILSHNPEAGNLVQSEVTDILPINPDQIRSVKFSTGRQILVDGQNFTIYGMDVDYPCAGLQHFSLEDAQSRRIVVPFAKKISGFSSSGEPIPSVLVTDDEDCPFQTLKLDFDFGWTLGALTGNGWWDKVDQDFYSNGCWPSRRNINFADLPGHCAKRLHEFFQDRCCLDWVTPRYTRREQNRTSQPARYGDTVKHTFMFPWAETFCNFLTFQLGGERDESTSGAANKHLPNFFLNTPEQFRKGLLCGLVDTDGSCSVSNAKGKPQLLCQYSSTSLRLCWEIVLLCRSLGIEATISDSKTTDAGNKLWLVGMSAVDCKRLNIFQELANTHKRKAFLGTPVSDKNVSQKYNKAVYPRNIAERIQADFCAYGNKKGGGSSDSELDSKDTDTEKHHTNIRKQLQTGLKKGIVARWAVHTALDKIRKWTVAREASIQNAVKVLREDLLQADYIINAAQVTAIRNALSAISPKPDTRERISMRNRFYSYTNRPLRLGRISPSTVTTLLEWIQSAPMYQDATHDPEVIHWIQHHLSNEDICWASIKSIDPVQDTDEIPAFSLVVPGHGNYMDISGIFIGTTTCALDMKSPTCQR